MFKFAGYDFNKETFVANFNYADQNNLTYTETIHFQKNHDFNENAAELLDRALELCFLIIGTSYYKAHPTPKVELSIPVDDFKKQFLDAVYQNGLSQFAFENHLTKKNLAHFEITSKDLENSLTLPYKKGRALALQSGGKDSLVTATLLDKTKKDWSALYIGSTNHYPNLLNNLGVPVETILRLVDINGLNNAKNVSGYMNGHVPVTYILMSIALVQAILDEKSYIITSIGHEGEEPHSIINDEFGSLPVNHQWSKTFIAETMFAKYVHRYISKDLEVGSLLRGYSELKIAEIFTKECWDKYGNEFSSCNVANYRQKNDNSKLTWCGDCAKCANAFLIFAPFIDCDKLYQIFGEKDLFENKNLINDFKGLLGIDGEQKPFECVGEIAELRQAYHMKKSCYKDLPFVVPQNTTFNYEQLFETQEFVKSFLEN